MQFSLRMDYFDPRCWKSVPTLWQRVMRIADASQGTEERGSPGGSHVGLVGSEEPWGMNSLLRAALDHGHTAQQALAVLAAASMALSSAAGLVFFTWSQFLFCSA